MGFAAMYGIWLGALSHVLLAAIGLSAVIAASAYAFLVVKVLGAAYLVWLGVQALFSIEPAAKPKPTLSLTRLSVFHQGMLVAALNPKTAIFFLSFLPQFIVPGAGSNSAQLLLHGVLVIGVAVFVEPPLILMGAKLRQSMSPNSSLGQWLDRAVGVMFIGLGLRLAATTSV